MATRSVRRKEVVSPIYTGDTNTMNDDSTSYTDTDNTYPATNTYTTTTKPAPLYWDKSRDIALVRSIRRGATNMIALLEALRDSPEFDGVADSLTPRRVAQALTRLRKAGVHGIALERNQLGGRRARYTEDDINELNLVT